MTSRVLVVRNRERKLNTNSFFSNFSGTSGISCQKSRDIPPKNLVSLSFELHTELFGPPPLHVFARSSGLAFSSLKEICCCKGILTRIWHCAVYCDFSLEDSSTIHYCEKPPSEHPPPFEFPEAFPETNLETLRKHYHSKF